MKLMRFGFIALCTLVVIHAAFAQSDESYRRMLTARVRAERLPSSSHLKPYVQDGKIRLSLRDAILLTLENNSNIQIQETQIETQKFSLLGAHQLFDPALQSSLDINRYSYPGYSQLQGISQSSNAVLNTLSQTGQIKYTQTFVTGTNVVVGLSSSKSSTNSSFYYFNPYFSTSLNLQFTQPLLRNAGRFANTAPLKIARRGLAESKATFEAEVNDALLQVISQYWSAVQARGALDVQQRALQLAEVSFQRDKRALELGALPPLDISRSESEVASRKVQQIQAAYALTQMEEALRITIGADQDAEFRTLELELTENSEPTGDLANANMDEVLRQALTERPEIAASADALAGDDVSVRLARSQLKPDMSLAGFYQSDGLGGNQYDLLTGKLTSAGGLGTSFNQLFNFGYPGYGGTLTLNLPIKNRAAQARLGSAQVVRTRDLYNERLVQEQITRQVRDAVHQLDQAKLSVTAAMTSFELAKKSLAADQRKFELGAETNFFVLDSQERLAQAELVLLQARVNYQEALAAINHASGRLLAPYHVEIDETTK